MVGSYEGKPKLSDLVASEGRRSIVSVGSDFGNVQHDSRLGRTTCLILGVGWGGDGVPEEIGTFLTGSKCLANLSPV